MPRRPIDHNVRFLPPPQIRHVFLQVQGLLHRGREL